MKVGYYPGCSLHSTAADYGLSTEAVCRKMNIDLAEIPDWNCCGATPAHSTSDFLAKALPLRNLIIAEGSGLDLVVPCTGCYNVCRQTHGFINRGSSKAMDMNSKLASVMGKRYEGKIRIMHLLEFFSQDAVKAELRNRVVKPLNGLKVVPYYGCLLLRPAADVAFDDPEQPQALDRLLEMLGAEVRPWSYKMDCCGGSFAIARSDVVTDLTAELVKQARKAGAEAMVTACPLCQANIDTRQAEAGMPIVYFTEMIATAMGMPGQDRWLSKHIIDPRPALKNHKLI
ncbi:CoB--CoM heterodisulfide reductase iron-sulfur subunit B family protein [Phosphitispora sp. TUW77]|uniref:CoB--CoM heterodisulfide reductase iron-sulfur subunit B family protein n=1 Tax=Phosphitispora sp. TUW77 TaxID=3152361 RepID=UPI003AB805DB